MSCPDINLILEGRESGSLDPELQAHLDRCPACQASLRILEALPGAMRPQTQVPSRMQERALSGVLEARIQEAKAPHAGPVLTTLGLACITVFGVLFYTASGNLDITVISLTSLFFGALVALGRWEMLRRRRPKLKPPSEGEGVPGTPDFLDR